MAKLSDLNLRYFLFMKAYRYRSVDWTPGTRLSKPLEEANLAVITTAALYLPDQTPFDQEDKGGDVSFRTIPADAALDQLLLGHKSSAFDPDGVLKDKNLALPFDRLRKLVEEGRIGSLNHRHFSFSGSITAPGRLIARTAPQVAELLLEDKVDAALLTPV